jgi:pilus assembly protein CpaF
VADVLVNSYRNVYVERYGRLERTEVQFRDERHLMRIIDKIVSRIGRRVDESQPWVDARLEDGSRVNVIIRPCAVDGPTVSIRKFSRDPLTLDRLVEIGTLTPEAVNLCAGSSRRGSTSSSRAARARARPPCSTRYRPSSTRRSGS